MPQLNRARREWPIGFMQGRLSPMVDGKIQAFPWSYWEDEFALAAQEAFPVMEWTLDQERLHENPLLTPRGRQRIGELSAKYGVRVASITGDCFMQAPFWKAFGAARHALQEDFMAVARAAGQSGALMVVVPLVDRGALANRSEEDELVAWLLSSRDQFKDCGSRILFECDYGPQELGRFIERLPEPEFGINYDTGNSAALGYRPAEEFSCYGRRICNVHIKDRPLGGTTVPLGTGGADFPAIFEQLLATGYSGNLILQTARARDGDHRTALAAYRDQVKGWMDA